MVNPSINSTHATAFPVGNPDIKNTLNVSRSFVSQYLKRYFLLKLYNLYVFKCQSTQKKLPFFFSCSFFFKLLGYDEVESFYRLAERSIYFFLYPLFYFEKFISVWTHKGKKEKFLTLWSRFASHLLSGGISHTTYVYFSMVSFWFPFILEPWRKGRKLFRIPQNIKLRRSFSLLNHRLKKTVQGIPELSLFYNWCYLLVSFFNVYWRRLGFCHFRDVTLVISERYISYRRPLSSREKEKERRLKTPAVKPLIPKH